MRSRIVEYGLGYKDLQEKKRKKEGEITPRSLLLVGGVIAAFTLAGIYSLDKEQQIIESKNQQHMEENNIIYDPESQSYIFCGEDPSLEDIEKGCQRKY